LGSPAVQYKQFKANNSTQEQFIAGQITAESIHCKKFTAKSYKKNTIHHRGNLPQTIYRWEGYCRSGSP
jgi:hypothetical protein